VRFSSKDCPFTNYDLGDIDTRLNALSTNEDPYLKFIGFLLKSFMLREGPEFSADKKGLEPNIAKVFAPILNSPSFFVRFMAYKLTVSFYSSFDKQLDFLGSNRKRFPESYNPKIDLAIAKLFIEGNPAEREEFRSKVISSLDAIMEKDGEGKQKAKAKYRKARILHHSGDAKLAAELYRELLVGDDIIDKFKILGDFIGLLHYGPEEVKDDARALAFCEEILAKKETAGEWIVSNAIGHMISILASSPLIENQRRAYKMAQKAFDDKSSSEALRNNALLNMFQLLQHGPDGIKNPRRALEMAEGMMKNPTLPEHIRGDAFNSLMQLLQHGPDGTRDHHRAIKIAEEMINNPVSPKDLRDLAHKHLMYLLKEGPDGIRDHHRAIKMAEGMMRDPTLPDYIRGDAFNSLMYLLKDGPDGIKDPSRALKMAEGMMKNTTLPEHIRGDAFNRLMYLLKEGPDGIKDPSRAREMAEGMMIDPTLPEYIRSDAFNRLIQILQYGPDGVKNHVKALELLEMYPDYRTKPGVTNHLLRSLANLRHHGDSEVKDLAKAIEVYQKMLEFKEFEVDALKELISIYGTSEAPYRNLPEALATHRRLIALFQNEPAEQIAALENLLRFYANTANVEISDFAAAQTVANQILAHPNVTNAITLNVQVHLSAIHARNVRVHLSAIHARHPELVTPDVGHQVHYALAHNPMADPIDRENAYNRLIAVYKLQGKLPEIVVAYEENLAGAEDWQRLSVFNSFIAFLSDPENIAVANADRLAELIAKRTFSF
jgi:uncharacterized protein (UPF0147 family)